MTQAKAVLFALAGVLTVLVPATPVTAQNSIGSGNPMNQLSMPSKQEDPRDIERREEVDRAYRATKGTLPVQAGTVDPWANMRGTEETKPAARPASSPKKKPAQ